MICLQLVTRVGGALSRGQLQSLNFTLADLLGLLGKTDMTMTTLFDERLCYANSNQAVNLEVPDDSCSVSVLNAMSVPN